MFLIGEIKLRRPKMANTTTNQNKSTFWTSVKSARKMYLENNLNSVELCEELIIAKESFSKNKKTQTWVSYVEKVFKDDLSKEYIENFLKAFVNNQYKIPTAKMVDAASKPVEEEKKEPVIFPKEMKPKAFEIDKTLSSNWDYWDSVKKVRGLYLRWSSVSSEMLRELYIAKYAITNGFTRTSGKTKEGELSWSKYVSEAFPDGLISKRTLDSYLNAYRKNGFVKPKNLTIQPVSDPSKFVVKSTTKLANGRIQVELYLPEYDQTYIQSFKA